LFSYYYYIIIIKPFSCGGPGAGADSFFEYLLKGAILFDEADYYAMFEEVRHTRTTRHDTHRTHRTHRTHSSFHGGCPTQAYEAILAYVLHDGWYFVVEMNSGKMVLPYFDALSAFWPGLQVPLVVCRCVVKLRWRSVADVRRSSRPRCCSGT
jgi:hypothetical protein